MSTLVNGDSSTANLIFLKTLETLLKHRDGIVINLNEELESKFPFKRAIVYNMNGNIHITEEGSGFSEGQRLYID